MSSAKFIAYYRVSTRKQERSGLGLEAQRRDVGNFLQWRGGDLLATYQDVESGKHDDRPQLQRAMDHCRMSGAQLIVAKLDRLSRDVAFVAQLQKAGMVSFIAADMPEAGEFQVQMMAVFSQHERKLISQRTKAALQSARARGVKLGNPQNLKNQALGSERGNARKSQLAASYAADVMPWIEEARKGGARSLRELAAALNDAGIRTRRGGDWSAVQVARVMGRAALP